MRRAQQQSGSSFDFTSALYAASLAKINSITLQIVRRREGGPSVDSEQSPQPPALEFLSAGRTKLRAKTLVWVLRLQESEREKAIRLEQQGSGRPDGTGVRPLRCF